MNPLIRFVLLLALAWSCQLLHAEEITKSDGQVFTSSSIRRSGAMVMIKVTTPEGGMGISRQLKDEVFQCPPVLLVTARPDDAWLAAWSRADAVIVHPIDPFTVADRVATLLRQHILATSLLVRTSTH